ncbi:MAG: hypothetical protein C3F17_21380 [Bradyrhizobiaceae bacterium]|nr:MAG: hypothetical protein C3F17_21380 [Bradyrhizobiaceae bacterium]
MQNLMPAPSLIDELEDALASTTAEKRHAALWRVTDLFISGADRYSDDQIGLFDDVIARLASDIEAKARARLASRLARIPNAPGGVVQSLAEDDDIAVAGEILRYSPRLDERHLVATASSKSQEHLLAISQRSSLSETVTDVLVQRGDPEVVRAVAENSGARFSNAAFRTLVERSNGDDILATTVGLRKDLPRPHFLKLLECASASVRQKLAAADPDAAAAVRDVVAEIDGSIRAAARQASSDFANAREEVAALHAAGRLTEAEVYAYADAHKFEETALALSLLAKVPIDFVERAMLDAQPDMIVILSKVAGLTWTTAKCILVRASGRAMSVQDLDRALAGFTRLRSETARSIIAFYEARRKGAAAMPAAS